MTIGAPLVRTHKHTHTYTDPPQRRLYVLFAYKAIIQIILLLEYEQNNALQFAKCKTFIPELFCLFIWLKQ
jgi:hypothetical protein